jgi:transposase-like protein
MADITGVDLARRVGEELEQASPDLLRAMVKTFAEALMGAEADAICGAPYGQPSVVGPRTLGRPDHHGERVGKRGSSGCLAGG